MSSKKSLKRVLVLDDDDDDHHQEEDKVCRLKVLLPNGTSVSLTLANPQSEMPMTSFVNLVKEKYDRSRINCELSGKMRKLIDWKLATRSYHVFNGERIKGKVRFETFKPDSCNIITLNDGSGETSIMYDNMWDLTPDTDLLRELPENYSFETALADLIDNSLQALWYNSPNEQRLISVYVLEDRIILFDSGPGMDSNDIVKWGKIGASINRSHKSKAIGGKPPYLMPFFGMFGYGGAFACMHLGRRTLLSTKTKESRNVLSLQLSQEALIDNRSVSGKNWRTGGGVRYPSVEEMKLSPHGSFTKIFELKGKFPEIDKLKCKLNDIYFLYIQCDEIFETERTQRPVVFQVNGEDLAGIEGGVVATTNLNSRGQEFSFQIRFTVQDENTKGTLQEANARLKFVYFPILKGKESINIILEDLKKEGYKISKTFRSFGRVSVRRLGRLLPEVPWASIPFMERGARATTLQLCCRRVICFVDLDAGFSPTPSKTDLASQNIFTEALKNFGSKSKEKDNDVDIKIHIEEKSLVYAQVEQCYQEWVLEMHKNYDVEDATGEDEAVVVLDSLDIKALCLSPDCKAVRVHKVMKRKGMTWKRGQKIKILKAACAGVHKNDVYATIDCFLIEGFRGEAGGDARIICRQINYSKSEGCTLLVKDGIPRLKIQSSSSFPISIIDSGKCLHLSENAWNKKLEKQREKEPSKIDLLDAEDCRELNFNRESKMASATNPKVVPTQEPPCSHVRGFPIGGSSSARSSQIGSMDVVVFTEILKEKFNKYVERIVEIDERLIKMSLKHLGATFPECLSTKESMMKLIEEKFHDTAASVFCCLYRNAPPPQSPFLSKKGVFGLVALLGSVSSNALSRVLSEYLGKDTMLTLVSKSSSFGPNTAEYLSLQFDADRLGRSITNRFHVICLNATRPWIKGFVEDDPQMKLAMDNPNLPDGNLIPGFKGYAVNMIELAREELNIKTNAGHGLRETLFYGLFGNLQVYETQNDVELALPYINGGGAVSLDGFIAKENVFIYSGRSKPEIHFPITVSEDEKEKLRKLEETRDRMIMVANRIMEDRYMSLKLERKLKKTNEKYVNARNLF